jgi:hypothetical protein
MSFRNWYSGKKRLDLSKRSPAVQSLIKRTIAYLRQRAAENPTAQIRPAMLATAIGENEMIALTALSILQRAGITKAHLGLYCGATMQWMGEVEPGRPAPKTLSCDACLGEQHDLDSGSMRREIFFTFDPKALAEVKEAA